MVTRRRVCGNPREFFRASPRMFRRVRGPKIDVDLHGFNEHCRYKLETLRIRRPLPRGQIILKRFRRIERITVTC